MLDHILGGNREESSATTMHSCAFCTATQYLDAFMSQKFVDAFLISAMNAGGQHDSRSNLAERCGGRCNKCIESGTFQRDHQAWVRAELTHAHRERGDEVLAQRFSACGECTRQ